MKILTARKKHTCVICNGEIKIGEQYESFKTRHPRYEQIGDEDGKQIGVQYESLATHLKELFCHMNEDCKAGNHKFTTYPPYSDENQYLEGIIMCDQCGEEKVI